MTLDELIDEYELSFMENDWNSLSPKERIALYLSAKEFQRAKMQRTSLNPNDQELPKDIYDD